MEIKFDSPQPGQPPGLQLTRAHRELADRHTDLQLGLNKSDTVASVAALSKTLSEFEDGFRQERERILQAGLIKTDGDLAVSEWMATRYDHLSHIAYDLVPSGLVADSPLPAEVAPAWTLAFLLIGHAGKWRKVAGLRPDAIARERLHQLFISAHKTGVAGLTQRIMVDRYIAEANAEALYVRALLLDRFASGNLSSRRLEILDSWLVTSMGSLWLAKTPDLAGPNLCVDPKTPTSGLYPHNPKERARFYLSLRPLQRQLARTVESFHHGNIFPGWGIGVNFRIEDHVGVVEFLEREFSILDVAANQKSKRLNVKTNAPVTAFVGFNDIYSRALAQQTTLITGGSQPSYAAAPAPTESRSGLSVSAMRVPGSESTALGGFDVIRGPVYLVDISDSGIGIEMPTDEAAQVDVDNMIALRIEEGRPCILGVVVRKAAIQNRYATLVGVRVLSKTPLRATLEQVHDGTGASRPAVKAILIGGRAEHGFGDSIIVNDSTFKYNPVMSITMASNIFHLRLGRVRHQGPGWKLCAVEVVVAR